MHAKEEEHKRVYMEEILEALKKTPGVRGCLLVDAEGFILADAMPGSLNAGDAAAIAAQVYGASKNFDSELNQGPIEEVLIEGSRKTTILRNADKGLLVAILEKNANLGFLRREVKKAAEKLRAALYEPTPVDRVSYRDWGGVEEKMGAQSESPGTRKSAAAINIREVLLKKYRERRANDPTLPKETLQEKLPMEKLSKPERGESIPSRTALLEKYRLKDPDERFIDEILEINQSECSDVLSRIKDDLSALISREAVDMEIEKQLDALHVDTKHLTCRDIRQLVKNLGDFLIAIAGEEEAKAMLKKFDDYIPHHLPPP